VELEGNTTLTDSVAVARTGGSAVYAGGGSHQVLNVTAWAVGEGSLGIHASSGADVAVTDTIARGEAGDLSADAAATDGADCVLDASCPTGQMTVSYSNFRTGAGIRDGGANQSGDPSFVDAGALDFHLRPGSQAIDSGKPGLSPSSADRDGAYRWLGKASDMGAYEYRAPRTQRPRGDVIEPVLTGLRLAPRRFRVARRGIAFSAANPRPAGTFLSFSLSEDADVVLLVSPARPHAQAIGAIVRGFARGAHRMRISGASEHGFLRPGRYVLTVVGRDLAQNLSRARRITFVVTR